MSELNAEELTTSWSATGPFSEATRLPVDPEVYSREAVLRTCYWLMDRAFMLITFESDRYWIHLVPKDGLDAESLVTDFSNSLLENELRTQIATETGQLRQLIVAKAFAEADLLDDVPPGDFRDPVDTGRGWNEMHV